MFCARLLATSSFDVIVAGGMESMTNAPYLLPKARSGLRMGHGQVIDHMFYDGLEDAYDKGRLMGTFAEDCASKYSFTREAQDHFAITSLQRAQKANTEGWFAWETTPIAIKAGKDEKFVEPTSIPHGNLEKIPALKPAFRRRYVHRCQLSSISDGAAGRHDAHIAAKRLSRAARRSVAMPRTARLPASSPPRPSVRCDPLTRTGWNANQVDLYEITEAFAVVTMAAMRNTSCRTTMSTSTAARAPSATRSALRARVSWSR